MSQLLQLKLHLLAPALAVLLCCQPGASQQPSGQKAAEAASEPGASAPRPDPAKAEEAYLAGARLLDRKEFSGAQAEFARAAALDPAHSEYALALTVTREHRVSELIQQSARARLTNHPAQADTLLAQARVIDPQNELVVQHDGSAAALSAVTPQARIVPAPGITYAGPIVLAPSGAPQQFHLRGDARQVITQLAQAYGIKTVFDEAPDSGQIRFDLDSSSYADAMAVALRMTHLFAVPVDPRTLLVAKDTQDNRMRLERQVEETLYLPGSTTEQLNELSNIIKNVFDIRQVVVSPNAGSILIRAPEATLKVANYTIADLVDGSAEIMLEIKLISVDKSRTVNLGATTPTSVGAFSVAAEAQSIVANNQTAVSTLISSGGYVPTGNYAKDILAEAALLVFSGVVTDANISNLIGTFGGGLTLFGINFGGTATFNLALNSSDARALDDLNVRVGDRQTTILRVGEKYPITTSTYSSGVSSSAASLLAGKTINGVSASSLLAQYLGTSTTATIPFIQFEDLGITLKTTPTVLKSGLVSVKVDLKIEALTGASLDNIPILTSRAFTSDIMLQDGATAVMLSELSNTESAAISGIPGLADLPGFQDTLADKLKNVASSELVLLVTPHIIHHRRNEIASRRIPFTSSVPVD